MFTRGGVLPPANLILPVTVNLIERADNLSGWPKLQTQDVTVFTLIHNLAWRVIPPAMLLSVVGKICRVPKEWC